MSTAQEIEDAIRSLPKKERQKLINDLPSILPELATDEWERIISDTRPRAALTALGDAIEAQMKTNPAAFPLIKESDFDALPTAILNKGKFTSKGRRKNER